jgi:hypothetical protein
MAKKLKAKKFGDVFGGEYELVVRTATATETEKIRKERKQLKDLKEGEVLVAKKSILGNYSCPKPGEKIVVMRVIKDLTNDKDGDPYDFTAILIRGETKQECPFASWYFQRPKKA